LLPKSSGEIDSMNSTRVFALGVALCLLLSSCSSPSSPIVNSAPNSAAQKPYSLPAEFSIKPVAERGPESEIYISGTTNFPDGMKIWVVLGPKKAQQEAFVNGGKFRSGALYPGMAVSGRQPLEVIAYFNAAWQNSTVRSQLGEGGKNLHGALFKLKDPDVVDSDKMLDAKFILTLPSIAPESNAISIVKHAILTVPGNGRSATDIEENIKLFEAPGSGVNPGKGWSATPAGAGAYNVAYDFIDGAAGEKQAIWSVNTATKQVKYVNYAAKLFSWTPNY
jgi:hypothetical protein